MLADFIRVDFPQGRERITDGESQNRVLGLILCGFILHGSQGLSNTLCTTSSTTAATPAAAFVLGG